MDASRVGAISARSRRDLGAISAMRLDPAKLSERHTELLAHARVRADAGRDRLGGAEAGGGQRDAATLGEGLYEHVPAEAAAVL